MFRMVKIINTVSCILAIKGQLSVNKDGLTSRELSRRLNHSRFQIIHALRKMKEKKQIKWLPFWYDQFSYTRKYFLTQE